MVEGAEGPALMKNKRRRFSKRPPDGPFGPNAAWIHGGCGTPEYCAYTTAKTLCANPKNPRWAQYGGAWDRVSVSLVRLVFGASGQAPRGEGLAPHRQRRALRDRQRT